MNIDGNPSNSNNGIVDNLEASDSIALTGKYVLPTDTPLANEVIQATNVLRPDGSRLTQWQILAGTGDVSSSTSTTVDNEICVFNSTSGKIIKNSNTLVSALCRNPAIVDLNINNFNITNVSNIDALSSTIGGWTTSANGRLNYRSSDDSGAYIFQEVGGSFSIRKFSDSLEPQIVFQRTRGNFTTPTAITNNEAIGRIYFTGNDTGFNTAQGALFNIKSTENWNSTSHGSEIEFQTANNGATVLDTKLTIATDGVKISNSYYLPTTAPITNQILTANGASSSTWSSNLNVGAVVSTSLQTNSVQTNSVQASTVIATSVSASTSVTSENFILGSTSSIANSKCVIMKFETFTAMEKGRVVTIIDDNGVAKIIKILNTDPDSEIVIGITDEAGAINSDVGVCIGGVFEACVQNGETITIGQFLEKSGNGSAANQGRVTGSNSASIGTFGIALTTATGDGAGTVFIKGLYKKNESF
jgi:hypothetical protein